MPGLSLGKSKSKNSSQQTSSSYNQAYPFIQDTYAPQIAQGQGASSALSAMLGLNGAPAQNEGFDNFRNSSGYDFIRNQGMDGVTGNLAAKGLLNSGSALKAYGQYNNGLASSFLDKYLQSLQGLSGQGIQLGQLISGAGNVSNSQGTSTGKSSGFNFGISK